MPEVAEQLLNGQAMEHSCSPGWPHEQTLSSIRLALEAGHDPGWLVACNDLIVGECAVKGGQPYDGEVEISYGLAGSKRNRGIGTTVVAMLTEWLLAQPGINAVTAEVRTDNVASIRVLEKAAFRRIDDANESYQRFSRST